MSVVKFLFFFLVPAVVAISADLGHFVLFVVLICVMAGLAQPMSGPSSAFDGEDMGADAKLRSVRVVSALSAN